MPSLGNLLDWVKSEGANLIWIIMIGFAIKFLSKQEWVKMVIFLVAAGATFYIVQNPSVVSNTLKWFGEAFFK